MKELKKKGGTRTSGGRLLSGALFPMIWSGAVRFKDKILTYSRYQETFLQ
jgi:hypothetical protein